MSDAADLCRHLTGRARQRLLAALDALEPTVRRDIYVLALELSPGGAADDEDERRLDLHARWNTREHALADAREYGQPDDAHWMWSRWVQQDGVALIDDRDDELRTAWVKALGLWVEPNEMPPRRDPIDARVDLWVHARRALVAFAVELNRRGELQSALGAVAPIQALTSDGSDPHMRMTMDANPQGLPEDLYVWFDHLDAEGPDAIY